MISGDSIIFDGCMTFGYLNTTLKLLKLAGDIDLTSAALIGPYSFGLAEAEVD